jgi:DNA repair protein RecO (recombination protein O)
VDGAVFDLREGVFSATMPLHRDVLMPEDAKKMQILMRMTPSNLHLFRFSREERNRVVDLCLKFYRLHIPQFGEMKTLEVLQALFV